MWKKLQAFPNSFEEFKINSKIKYEFIEFFEERNYNNKNPIWSNEGVKNYIRFKRLNNMKIYSFRGDYFIKNSLAEKETLTYALKILKRINLLKIKKYVIPLYEGSFVNFKNNQESIHYF